MQVTPVIDDAGDHAALPVRAAGRAVDAGRAARGVEAPPAGRDAVTTTSSACCSSARRATSPALRIFDPEYPDRAVVAAGAPWFMTLFGRDSLLTSWMTMLVDPDLALGTLQTLARFQGTQVDPITEEEPGRILHEMRFGETASLALGGGRIYYGTVDATPLFVMLVGELSRWGNRRDEVDALLPAADRALAWIDGVRRQGRRRLRRVPAHERPGPAEPGLEGLLGLDALLRRLAWRRPPIALCEVQGYVYAALDRAVAHRDRSRATTSSRQSLRARADELKRRFNEDFWVDDDDGGYFAMGLDRDKRPIDGIGSNMGHCLWTGIVDEEKAPRSSRALTDPGDVQRLGHPHAVGVDDAATTRSRTTAAASGRTTTRSAPPA